MEMVCSGFLPKSRKPRSAPAPSMFSTLPCRATTLLTILGLRSRPSRACSPNSRNWEPSSSNSARRVHLTNTARLKAMSASLDERLSTRVALQDAAARNSCALAPFSALRAFCCSAPVSLSRARNKQAQSRAREAIGRTSLLELPSRWRGPGHANVDIPSFHEIAGKSGQTEGAIMAHIVLPKHPMPTIPLTKSEFADLAAYMPPISYMPPI